jgi:hypothetical protein
MQSEEGHVFFFTHSLFFASADHIDVDSNAPSTPPNRELPKAPVSSPAVPQLPAPILDGELLSYSIGLTLDPQYAMNFARMN